MTLCGQLPRGHRTHVSWVGGLIRAGSGGEWAGGRATRQETGRWGRRWVPHRWAGSGASRGAGEDPAPQEELDMYHPQRPCLGQSPPVLPPALPSAAAQTWSTHSQLPHWPTPPAWHPEPSYPRMGHGSFAFPSPHTCGPEGPGSQLACSKALLGRIIKGMVVNGSLGSSARL